MFVLKADLKEAQKAKTFLLNENLIDNNYYLEKDEFYIYFPLIGDIDIMTTPLKDASVIKKEMKKKQYNSKNNIRDELEGKLSEEEFEKLKTAHDTVGTIAILEIDEDLRHKEKEIAKALLMSNKNIKTVLRKDAGHEGEFRTQKMKFLAGDDTKVTIHKENGVLLKLDVEKVYFSPRLSTERKRIYQLVKKGEKILVMFSGCAPYPCVLSKNTKAKNILGIEINPQGHKYGLENIDINKLKNVSLICGDVKKEIPKIEEKYDRILMPLPKDAGLFLSSALKVSKKGTIIHFYNFVHEDDFSKIDLVIDDACKLAGKKWKKLDFVKCGQHAIRTFRICFDFEVLS